MGANRSAKAKEYAAIGFTDAVTAISLHTADPGTTGASEVAGGTYARQTPTWTAGASDGAVVTDQMTFDVPADTTITHAGMWDNAGAWLDAAPVAATFVSAGQLFFTLTHQEN